MSSQSLYRKWRSQNFEEIVGQQRVTRTLQNALRTNRLAHAYLFCGPRGVGKTSAARVLAKAVNCLNNVDGEPCNECSICRTIGEGRCLDIIEIDAASNRGIDEIRDLREKVNFSPSEAKYKFYILDEVHMLTSEAFNALLKTLEEPPAHAVFVLVTTESHKVPATILSRCQRFDFQRISLKELVARLSVICDAEGIEVETSALELIGRLSTGSLRDAESLLDQLVSYCGNKIALADVHMVVGMTGSSAAREMAVHLVNGDIPSGLHLINQIAGEGADLRQFCREVVEYLRSLMVLKVGGRSDLLDVTGETLREMEQLSEQTSVDFLIRAIRLFTNAEVSQRTSLHVQLPVELAFVEAVLPPAQQEIARQSAPVRTASPQPPVTRPVVEPVKAATHPSASAASGSERMIKEQAEAGINDAVKSEGEEITVPQVVKNEQLADDVQASGAEDMWRRVMEKCGSTDRKVQALLKACDLVGVDQETVHLEFRFSFHKEQIENPKNAGIVETVLKEVLGRQVRVKCTLGSQEGKKATKSVLEDPVVKAAIEFGAKIKKVDVARDDAG